jgi:hypothetical protein
MNVRYVWPTTTAMIALLRFGFLAILDSVPDPLSSEEQRRRLCEILHTALIDIRAGDHARGRALANALHNLPKTMYGWGTWSVGGQRGRLSHFEADHPGGPKYVAMFDAIFPPSVSE